MVFVGAGTGQVARVPDDQPYFLGPNIAMIRSESSEASTAYMEYFLRSPLGNRLALISSKAVAQPSLSMGTIRLIPIALPPRSEQARIVAEIERLFSLTGESQKIVDGDLKRSHRLRQSILKWAFEGKLANQDPNDEPASVLLERFRAERAAHEETKSSARKPARSAKRS